MPAMKFPPVAVLAIVFAVGCATMQTAKLSRADAEEIALTRAPGGTVKESELGELEKEHGKLVWSFDIATPGTNDITEVQVDAVTGEVVSVEKETPARPQMERESDHREPGGHDHAKRGALPSQRLGIRSIDPTRLSRRPRSIGRGNICSSPLAIANAVRPRHRSYLTAGHGTLVLRYPPESVMASSKFPAAIAGTPFAQRACSAWDTTRAAASRSRISTSTRHEKNMKPSGNSVARVTSASSFFRTEMSTPSPRISVPNASASTAPPTACARTKPSSRLESVVST